MNPNKDINAREYEVRPIDHASAAEFIIKNHYSRGCSRTSVYDFGLFGIDSNILVGVSSWLPPTKVAAESLGYGWNI